jgi:predicted SAM-dependent methyltransferase
MNVAKDRIALASIEEANFGSKRFDFITFGAVLEHLYDPASAIEKSLKLLKKGGVIQIEVPSSNWFMSTFTNAFFRACGTNYVTNISPMHSPYHLYEFTEKSFKEHGKITGYEIVHSYFDVCSIPHAPNFLKPFFRYYMEKAKKGMQLTVWLRKSQ